MEVYVVPPLPVPVHELDAADKADGSHGAQDHQLLTGGWGTVNTYLGVYISQILRRILTVVFTDAIGHCVVWPLFSGKAEKIYG